MGARTAAGPLRDARRRGAAGGVTPLELLFLAAIAAMAAFAFVPDYFRARDGARVQLVARAAERCDLAVEEMLRDGAATNRADVTAAMVDRWLADRGRNPVYWPNGADLSTLDLADPAGTSVEVALRGGARRVSAADRRDDSDLSDR